VRAGKLRVLAVASREQIETLPNVPTVAESGYRNYEEEVWFGVVAPAKTPRETMFQLAGWFSAAVRAPEVRQKLAPQELYPVGACGTDFAAYLQKQYEAYGGLIREANIKPE
jgi:tripartite-type tricarboxylate transporter receptor subunit TctC